MICDRTHDARVGVVSRMVEWCVLARGMALANALGLREGMPRGGVTLGRTTVGCSVRPGWQRRAWRSPPLVARSPPPAANWQGRHGRQALMQARVRGRTSGVRGRLRVTAAKAAKAMEVAGAVEMDGPIRKVRRPT